MPPHQHSAAAGPYLPAGVRVLSVDHVATAVADLDAAVAQHVALLGLELVGVEEVPGHGVREALLAAPGGGTRVQLVAATSSGTPVGRFLARRGPGLHHVAYAVADLDAALAQLGEAVVPPGATSGGGGARVAFLHPRATGGVLVELVER
ncbi:methylmalonyl-CoA/ethylmalonyl-CoA epimerase [Motilibacter rhizosphaerae]|uniref:Methylmalonyl-CoA/ethylmalonyl-CoA epimerase n=1 Tax=Motilibacter rhizosphaerae TaxID=598652 RepID=A0A4Q7NP78_9ACTN|nr:VOC family protein [Motilibacter rhizosphaerae]RZS87084.1 methylmalonyl-CoA/ethylmalonyl-CoA epimerase [Motilibacter rhizosphaerae]